jgi:Na+-transporting NADH:ubiquinone oxidoreductase subunit NqrF
MLPSSDCRTGFFSSSQIGGRRMRRFSPICRHCEEKIQTYTFIPTMTKMTKSHHEWSGETGYIKKEMLAKYLGAAKSPIYYIVGPPKMVSGLHSIVNESGVDDDDIRTEDFSGY